MENPFRAATPIYPGRDLEYCFPIVDSIRKVVHAVTRWERRAFIDHLDLPGPCRPIQNDWTPFSRAFHLTASQLRFDLVSGSTMLLLGSALRLAHLCVYFRLVTASFGFTTVPPRY